MKTLAIIAMTIFIVAPLSISFGDDGDYYEYEDYDATYTDADMQAAFDRIESSDQRISANPFAFGSTSNQFDIESGPLAIDSITNPYNIDGGASPYELGGWNNPYSLDGGIPLSDDP